MQQVAISSQPIRVFIKVIEYFGTNKGDGCQIKVLYLDQFSKLISIERRQKNEMTKINFIFKEEKMIILIIIAVLIAILLVIILFILIRNRSLRIFWELQERFGRGQAKPSFRGICGQWIPVIQVQFNMQHTKNMLYCFVLFVVLIRGFERKKGPYVQNQSFFQIQHQMKNGKSQKEYEDRQFHQI